MHRELPIFFKGSMVRAILAGRKTQTRRIIKPQPEPVDTEASLEECREEGWRPWWWSCSAVRSMVLVDEPPMKSLSPYGSVGDKLWVRENWAPVSDYTGTDPGSAALGCGYFYQADYPSKVDSLHDELSRWRPSIFMPRAACRVRLEVSGVRVERIQDISVDDIEAEGLYRVCDSTDDEEDARGNRAGFADLWDSTNGRPKPVYRNKVIDHYVSYPWEGVREVREHRGRSWYVVPNPWVWCISFRRCD